jgi:hypothetical protein
MKGKSCWICLLLLLPLVGCSDDDHTPAKDAASEGVIADAALDLAPGDTVGTDLPVGAEAGADTGADTIPPLDSGPPVDSAPPGDGGWGISCTSPIGSASITGTVGGKAVQVSHAGGVKITWQGIVGYGVGMFSVGGTCAQVAQQVAAPTVWIVICNNLPGSYPVNQSCKPDGGAWAAIQTDVKLPDPAGGQGLEADSGTVTIDTFDPACGGQVKGSFSVMIGNDALQGTFDTVGCGDYQLP